LQAICRGGRGRRVRGGTPGGGEEEAFKRGRRRGVLVGLEFGRRMRKEGWEGGRGGPGRMEMDVGRRKRREEGEGGKKRSTRGLGWKEDVGAGAQTAMVL